MRDYEKVLFVFKQLGIKYQSVPTLFEVESGAFDGVAVYADLDPEGFYCSDGPLSSGIYFNEKGELLGPDYQPLQPRYIVARINKTKKEGATSEGKDH